jgi:hypothetical protein
VTACETCGRSLLRAGKRPRRFCPDCLRARWKSGSKQRGRRHNSFRADLSILHAADVAGCGVDELKLAVERGHCAHVIVPPYRNKRIEWLALAEWLWDRQSWVIPEEAARQLGTCRETIIRRWAKRGLPHRKIGTLWQIDMRRAPQWVQENVKPNKRMVRIAPRLDNDTQQGVIYCIKDPRTDQVRYIGKAADFKASKRLHLSVWKGQS